MSERRADQLVKGDLLSIGGRQWLVRKAKQRGKKVRLVVEASNGRDLYDREVSAKARYTVVVEASTAPARGRTTQERTGSARLATGNRPGPLLNAAGQMQRWATDAESQADGLEPPSEPRRTSPWEKVAAEDVPLIEELGARLLGVEVDGGKLIVPPVTDATILGHLLTMHGVRYDGATLADAKAASKEHDAGGVGQRRLLGVMDAITFEKAYRLHDDLHKDLLAMKTPHWHRERAPR